MRQTLLLLALLAVVAAAGASSGDVRGLVAEALDGDAAGVRGRLDGLGGWAVAVLVALALVHVVVPFPAELLTAAAGYALGAVTGTALMLAAWTVSALVAYLLAESAGRPLARRIAGAERLDRLERLLARGGARALLVLRLVPLVPFNATCAAAGLARVPVWTFTWTTLVGIAPLTALVAVLGARLQEPSLTDPALIGALAGCVLIVLLSPVARRLVRAEADA